MGLDELLRQAQAGDAHARAVYADALLAAGDPRGELIALETAGKSSARLRQRHAEAWFGAPWHCVKTAGGFPTGLAFAGDVPIIPDVEELECGMVPASLLVDLPRVRRLSLQGNVQLLPAQLRDAQLADRLEALAIGGMVGRHGGPFDAMPNLRALSVAGANGASDFFHWLFALDLSRIEELDLRSSGLNLYAFGNLLERDLRSLRVLKLSGNRLRDPGTAVLQRTLRRLPALERLELIDCDMEDITGMAITDRADAPAQLPLMGCTIEVAPVGRDRYMVLVDGEPRRVRLRTAKSLDGEPAVTTEAEPADDAPLHALWAALALGPQRIHTVEGAQVHLSSDTASAYSQAWMTTELAELDLRDEIIAITLVRHIDSGG